MPRLALTVDGASGGVRVVVPSEGRDGLHVNDAVAPLLILLEPHH
jgi:hypothetical protein